MPELPEVNEFKLILEGRLLDKKLQSVSIIDRSILRHCDQETFKSLFQGNVISEISQHGKYLFLKAGKDLWMIMHFGMTGNVSFSENDSYRPPYVKIQFNMEDGIIINYCSRRKLGFVSYTQDKQEYLRHKRLGPHVLEMSLEQWLQRGAGRSSPVKALLLNQSFVAGIGNLYADEALYQSRIHPLKKYSALDEDQRITLYNNIQDILHLSIEKHTLFPLLPQSYLLYDRKGRSKCPRCNHDLQKIQTGGRTSVYCPLCQLE